MLKTYRNRLIAYTILLVVFLTATLAYTYIYSRDVILEEAENNITTTAQILNGNLETEEIELLHYTEIVRDDLRIQEYMFMTVQLGTDTEALGTLYNRQFGWLPVERHIILAKDGRPLVGKQHQDLAQSVLNHLRASNEEIFYVQGNKGLEMITWAPILYQGKQLGVVALSHILNRAWLEQHHHFNGGYLFIEHEGIIQLSSFSEAEGKPFILNARGKLKINEESYSIRPVILSGLFGNTPRLWYGVSEKELLSKLAHHSRLVLMLAVGGSMVIFWIGMMMVQNFNKPLTELMRITQAVAQGKLPEMSKSHVSSEIDMLSNQFAEMLKALRDKQEEIDQVHEELKQSAITDSLTRLHNRRYLQSAYPKVLSQAQRESLIVIGLMLDIDFFKQINDRHGHLAGDQCLKHIAKLLTEFSRNNDYVFRIGGEEFFLLSLIDASEGGVVLAEKIRSAIEQHPAVFKDSIIPLTTSIGVSQAVFGRDFDESLTQLLFQSDKALYEAKSKGRNCVVVYTEPRSDSRRVRDGVS